jgi:hypothetical protein
MMFALEASISCKLSPMRAALQAVLAGLVTS